MSIRKTMQSLGPGLLYAGAAVGVSHLVQSTQAGAGFGFSLLWVIILANILKYPFFEFGPRYAAASGESLIEGYRRIWGGAPLAVFILMTLGTMFIIQGAVTIVTGGLGVYLVEYLDIETIGLFGHDMGIELWGKVWTEDGWKMNAVSMSWRLLVVCGLLLAVGKYRILDAAMKVIMVLLTITTFVALVIAVMDGQGNSGIGFDWGESALIISVIIPLVGWMPAPLDIAVWHSVWTLEKKKAKGGKLPVKSALFDFKIGYWGTMLLAICFLGMGALILYGSGQEIQKGAVPFARQLIDMYASSLGEWSRPIIAVAALTTMFSTTLTLLDAFPRVLQRSTELFFKPSAKIKRFDLYYWVWMVVVVVGTILLLAYFLSSMKAMVNLATSISFLTAPIIATFSYLAVKSKHVPPEFRPQGLLNILAIVGLAFLYLFAAYYLWLLL